MIYAFELRQRDAQTRQKIKAVLKYVLSNNNQTWILDISSAYATIPLRDYNLLPLEIKKQKRQPLQCYIELFIKFIPVKSASELVLNGLEVGYRYKLSYQELKEAEKEDPITIYNGKIDEEMVFAAEHFTIVTNWTVTKLAKSSLYSELMGLLSSLGTSNIKTLLHGTYDERKLKVKHKLVDCNSIYDVKELKPSLKVGKEAKGRKNRRSPF